VAGVALLALAGAPNQYVGAVLAAVPAIAGGLLVFTGGAGLRLPAVTGGRATPVASA